MLIIFFLFLTSKVFDLTILFDPGIFLHLYRKNPRGVLISPGPGKNYTHILFSVRHDNREYTRKASKEPCFLILGEPQDSGISLQTVLELGPTIPLFGVCMGLQCIGEAFGGTFFERSIQSC